MTVWCRDGSRTLRRAVYRLFAITALLALFGCQSKEYYRDMAVKSARRYVLEEYPNLSEENRAYIRFAQPRFMLKTLMFKPEMNQVCLVWTPPYLDGDSIVVAGVCGGEYDDWEPIRVIIKRLPVKEKPEE